MQNGKNRDEHWKLRRELVRSRVQLWQIHHFMGGKPSEKRLKRMLEGLVTMTPEVVAGGWEILRRLDGAPPVAAGETPDADENKQSKA